MYLDDSRDTVSTHARPQAGRLTKTISEPHHPLEDILSRPYVRQLFRLLTHCNREGKPLFERICENYDNDSLTGLERLKWALPSKLIDVFLRRYRLDKELMKQKLFHHHPTVRSLALTARSIARYGLTKPQRYTAPLFTVWNITQRCNLSCEHCYQNSGPHAAADELTLEEKLHVVDELADNWVPFLAIAGGEPLATKDLWPTLEHAHRRGIHLTVATNGTLLTPENMQRLIECGVKYVEVSIDSNDPAEHDRFRGRPGAWERAIQGIRNSVAAGMRTGLATCFTRNTVERVDAMVALAKSLGCATFSHFNFIPVGRGKDHANEDLTPDQREFLMKKLVDYLQCGAGRCYCCIQPNGDVTPCVYISTEVVGNLRRQSLAEIWDHELFRTLQDREDRGDHCGVCDYRVYCGGCRARALAYTGDITAGDPGCVYNRREWEEITAEAQRDQQLSVV